MLRVDGGLGVFTVSAGPCMKMIVCLVSPPSSSPFLLDIDRQFENGTVALPGGARAFGPDLRYFAGAPRVVRSVTGKYGVRPRGPVAGMLTGQ